MFPKSLLPHLSANACKTYLVLRAHLDPASPNPIVKVPMHDLVQLTGFSSRTCANALRELCTLGLLRRLRHGYHQSRSYLLLPFPRALAAPQPCLAHPKSPATPLSTSKRPNQQPVATLLNQASNLQRAAGITSLRNPLLLTQRIENLKRELALKRSPPQKTPQSLP